VRASKEERRKESKTTILVPLITQNPVSRSMDQEKPYHVPAADQHQPDDEAVVPDPADVVWDAWPEDAATMQEDVVAAAMEGGGADLLNFVGRAATENDEAIAHFLYMEQLREMEEENGEVRGFEESCPAGAFAVAGAAMPDVNQLEPMPDIFGAVAAHQQANNANRHRIGGRVIETVTIRLEPRKEALISARQAVLDGGTSTPTVFAGMEEADAQYDGWYDCIAQDAQRMEQLLDDPELCDDWDPFQFQQLRLRLSESPAREEVRDFHHITNNLASAGEEDSCREEFSLQRFTTRWGLDPSELDPDEPGPSTIKVSPLADAEVPSFDCGICIETLPVLDLFHGMQCDHRFCVKCMATYIEGRIHSGEVPIPCPDPACKQDENDDGCGLHPEECKKSIDFAVFGSWGDRLTERAIPPNRRAYCPNRQCGVMLETTGGKTPEISFCPACSHAMCASCGMDWDADGNNHDCDGGPEAALVKKMAAERRWKQCPKCKMLVERIWGCRVMHCRYWSLRLLTFAAPYLCLIRERILCPLMHIP
jgi:hypothetical protein